MLSRYARGQPGGLSLSASEEAELSEQLARLQTAWREDSFRGENLVRGEGAVLTGVQQEQSHGIWSSTSQQSNTAADRLLLCQLNSGG